MNIGMGIFIVVVIVSIAGAAVLLIRHSRRVKAETAAKDAKRAAKQTQERAARQAVALTWVQRIEQAESDAATIAVGAFPSYSADRLEDEERMDAAATKYAEAERNEKARKFRKAFDTAMPYDRAGLLLESRNNYVNLGVAFDLSDQQIGQLLLDNMAVALELFRQGDLVAMHEYHAVMRHWYLKDFCDHRGVKKPSYPADWDDLVDQHVERPVLSDYVNASDLTIEQVQTLAAQAVKHRDPLRAKRALALCRKETYVYGTPNRQGGGQSKQLVHEYEQALGAPMLFVLQMLVVDPANIDRYVGAVSQFPE